MLSGDEFEQIKATYLTVDKDRNGVISKKEYINAAFEQMLAEGNDLSEEDKEAINSMVDVDGDGKITFGEFLQTMAEFKYNVAQTEAGLKSMFKAFDRNGDGVLNKEELARVWKIMINPNAEEAEAEVEEIFGECDADGDGKISYDEFVAHVIPKLPGQA